jgi:nucleoredoxin
MEELVGPKLLTKLGEAPEPTTDLLENKELVLLYFSAAWCTTCRGFAPLLVDFYKAHAEKHNMEVIFVSSDRTISDFAAYYSRMPWLAIPTDEESTEIKERLVTTVGIVGIPRLIVLDGKTGELISVTAREEVVKVIRGDEVTSVVVQDDPVQAGNKLIAQWKAAPRRPISEGGVTADRGNWDKFLLILQWFLPISYFTLLLLRPYLLKMFPPTDDMDESITGMASDDQGAEL